MQTVLEREIPEAQCTKTLVQLKAHSQSRKSLFLSLSQSGCSVTLRDFSSQLQSLDSATLS